MKLYHLSIGTLVKRFLLIMAIIIGSGFLALYVSPACWYLTMLAFPVFVSCLLGIEINELHWPVKLEFGHHPATPGKHGRWAH
jgi:hypothetical protein